MKIIRGIKIGGLQQKIISLMLIFIAVLIGIYTAVSVMQQKSLTVIVQETSREQQASITAVSEETMEAVLNTSMLRTTALQAYIANDLFNDVRNDTLTLQTLTSKVFDYADQFTSIPVDIPRLENDGTPAVMMLHEEGVDPEDSESLGLVGNLGEIMLAMLKASDKVSSLFVGTADGNVVLVNERSGLYVGSDGAPLPLDIRHRPWYVQAAQAGEVIFTGVELDAYTQTPMLECAAPVYHDGELVAVVGADIYLTSIIDYVASVSSEDGFLCVVNENGQVLFSAQQDGVFEVVLSADAPDLRSSEYKELAAFVSEALEERTALTLLEVDGEEYYLSGAPMKTLGWAVLSVVEKERIDQPTQTMLSQYDEINSKAQSTFMSGAKQSTRIILFLTVLVVLLAFISALVQSSHVVKPLELLTKRINSLKNGEAAFTMDEAYRTGDEIEILAEAFNALNKRTQKYITEIVAITEEKKRIGTELALATKIQADMLPNIFPAFPERAEFDIYASMTPAKEVGGDFYDFFLIDNTHLGLVMADVSGKGVPAALFMMVSKILVQNYAMYNKSPAEVLRAVNEQICSNNREEMFVTVWFGVLDLETGKVVAANAGHEYPALRQGEGAFELMKDKHGFVIGGMEGVRYKEYEFTMTPGSKLFLYTDGVPEATDTQEEMFGTDRMLEALNIDAKASPEAILETVKDAVADFVDDAEPFDDMTMLCVEYKGTGADKTT